MKKIFLFRLLLIAISTVGFISCEDEVSPFSPSDKDANGIYILNAGKYKENNANLAYYDFETKQVKEVFQSTNGFTLGDQAYSMIAYGSKLYIAVQNSNTIFVTDKSGKVLKYISNNEKAGIDTEYYLDKDLLDPCYLDAAEGSVYVDLRRNGYVARIDTATVEINKKIKVGDNPEGLKIADRRIFVANSGLGKGSTVSVLDLALDNETKIEVHKNPADLILDSNNNLYLVTYMYKNSDTGEIYSNSSIQKIDIATTEVVDLYTAKGEETLNCAPIGDKLYIISTTWGEAGQKSEVNQYYDTKTKKIEKGSFIKDSSSTPAIHIVKENPITGDIYVTSPNGANNGLIYIYSKDGDFLNKFDSQGAFPRDLLFIRR